jgi:transaldolase / glucose-6-phosphate isomerase
MNNITSKELQKLTKLGQSLWYDNLSREMINDGTLSEYIAQGVVGLTSNPSIFHKSITSSNAYDLDIRNLVKRNRDPHAICEELFISDVVAAADLLKEVWVKSDKVDGYASLEVSPHLAHDLSGTLAAARRLWHKLDRPNVMIKIPATPEGIQATEILLGEGININITLIFSTKVYEQVCEAYTKAMEKRLQEGKSISSISSVASFFVSRLDSIVEQLLTENGFEAEIDRFIGITGVANCRLAYAYFNKFFQDARFIKLKNSGALLQRPLWASTGVKSNRLSKNYYVEKLVARDTVNTVPQQTLEAVLGGIEPQELLDIPESEANRLLNSLQQFAIDIDEVFDLLMAKGVSIFVDSYDSLIKAIDLKASAL